VEIRPRAARVALGLAVCVAGGALCAWARTPLPWMIGSILAMAIAQIAGLELEPLPGGRDAGLVIVGTALGLHFTAPVVHQVASYWPWFVALGFAGIAMGGTSGWLLARLSGTDRATAWFAMMPGGASEMAMTGERHGARTDSVAFAHSMRMLLTVTIFPIAITLAGFSAHEEFQDAFIAFSVPKIAVLFAIAAACGWLARRIGLPTAYMIGSLASTVALTVNGIQLSSVPTGFSSLAQVLLGCSLGARFDRTFLKSAPRFVAALVPSITLTLVLAALVGWGLALACGVYVGSGLLAAAPGGIAEMSITAKVLHMGVAFVTAAHVVRYVIVVLFTGTVFKLLTRRLR
jgi:membrane AbrB-like protein